MRAIQHIAYVALAVPDVDATAAWYTRALGLVDHGHGTGGAVALAGRTFGTAVVLRPAAAATLLGVGWALAEGSTQEAASWFTTMGLLVTDVSSLSGPGHGLQVRDAAGTAVELFEPVTPLAVGPSPGVIDLRKLSHATLRVPALDATVAFYSKTLGFRLSDRLSDRFAWMRCDTDHHGVAAIAAASAPGLHHLAFDVADWGEIKRACDHLHALGIPLEAGPLRHGPGRNIAIYFRDPNGVRIELTCEMEQLYDDHDRPGEWAGQNTFDVWRDAGAPPSWHDATPAMLGE